LRHTKFDTTLDEYVAKGCILSVREVELEIENWNKAAFVKDWVAQMRNWVPRSDFTR